MLGLHTSFKLAVLIRKITTRSQKSQLQTILSLYSSLLVKLYVRVIYATPFVFLITELLAALPNQNIDNNRFAEVENHVQVHKQTAVGDESLSELKKVL